MKKNYNLLSERDFDSITGFLNKNGFEKSFEDLLNCDLSENMIAIGIKARNVVEIQINYGYQVSEAYLKRLAGKIKILLRFAKILAFISPDIFIAILPLKDFKEIDELAIRLYYSLQGPFLFKSSYFPIKASLCICKLSKECQPKMLLNVMVRLADRSSLENKLIITEYEKEKKHIEENLPTYLSISKKISTGEVGFALQPVFNSKNCKIQFYEVLARLVSEKDILPPNKFMKKVQELKLMQDLERSILYKVLVYLYENKNLKQVSINISLDYIAERLELDLKQYLKEVPIDPNRVCLEVTEQPSKYKISMETIKNKLIKLKKKGFIIALDDFGLYHSNFGLLRDFPWDMVKIDGSFIQKILYTKFDYLLVKFLMKISKIKGFKVVAEFVDNKELLEELKNLGIPFLQGYLLGSPRFIPESVSIIPPLLYNFIN